MSKKESKDDRQYEVEVSCGNIFEDLEYPNPQEAKAKADLAIQIHDIIKKRRLTQTQAAGILGIDQPKVSDIIRGKLSSYTIDRLIRYVRLLGRDVEIRVAHRAKKSQPKGGLAVALMGKLLPQRRVST